MNKTDAISFIQQRLGFRSDRATEILSALVAAQTLAEQGDELPWFLLQEEASLTLSAAATSVSLPTGFLREATYGLGLHYYNSANKAVFLTKKSRKEALDVYAGADAGAPVVYTIRKSAFKVAPAANQEYTLYFDYYKADDSLNNNSTNSWLTYAPYYIIGEAGILISQDLGNKRLQSFQALSQTAREKWIKENAAREVANRTLVLGRKK